MSKRRNGFPSENCVKRGRRVVHGDKELSEKLGRNDPCVCGSGRSFQAVLPEVGMLLTAAIATTTGATEVATRKAARVARGRLAKAWPAREHRRGSSPLLSASSALRV